MTTQKKYVLTASFIAVVLALGMFATRLLWNHTVRTLSDDAMEQALIIAQSINPHRIHNLHGHPNDVHSPDYVRIKEQLIQMRLAHGTCRFLYLMGRRPDGTVFFFSDAQPPESADYAPPGLVYKEVSADYVRAFDSGKPATVGPITDRWGTLMTSLVPMHLPGTNDLIAVLGMDIDSGNWRREIIARIMLPISLTLSTALLTILLLIINLNRNIVREQYREKNKFAAELQLTLQHVKKLQGLLPICSSCKKIRDDTGYWNSIETYIQNHAEVEFSHSLCPDCCIRLYPELYAENALEPARQPPEKTPAVDTMHRPTD